MEADIVAVDGNPLNDIEELWPEYLKRSKAQKEMVGFFSST